MSETDNNNPKQCPECGADVENTIAYVRGHRTTDGWECTECNWSCLFGEEPWQEDQTD